MGPRNSITWTNIVASRLRNQPLLLILTEEKKFKRERNCGTKSPYRRNQRRKSEENTIREGDEIEFAIGNFEKQRQKCFWRGNDGEGHKDSILLVCGNGYYISKILVKFIPSIIIAHKQIRPTQRAYQIWWCSSVPKFQSIKKLYLL